MKPWLSRVRGQASTLVGMKLIGLTGGIGSGKSTVAALIAAQGFTVIDADRIARDIVEPGMPALAELARAFGEDILNEDGTLNRGLLAQCAFSDEKRTQLLNGIMHPRIDEETQRRFESARANGEQVVIYDMPLLVDKGLHEGMDQTVVVDVDVETRVKRLVEHRGLDEEDARRRIAAQIDDDARLAVADIIIDNNGSLEDLKPQVKSLVDKLRR